MIIKYPVENLTKFFRLGKIEKLGGGQMNTAPCRGQGVGCSWLNRKKRWLGAAGFLLLSCLLVTGAVWGAGRDDGVTLARKRTCRQTVVKVLRDAGIQQREWDSVRPPAEVKSSPGQRLLVAEEVEISYREIRVGSQALERGMVRVIQEGSNGLKKEFWEVLYDAGGREIGRELAETVLVEPPVERVVEYGENTAISRAGRQWEFTNVLVVEATAYCPGTVESGCIFDSQGNSACTGPYSDGRTATGIRAVAGDGTLENPHIIAVDPTVIPLKSFVYIEGYGFARAEDTGGAIKGKRIDLLLERHSQAVEFGRQTVKLYVLD